MYAILILSFITSLIVYSINSTQNFSGLFNGYWSKSQIISRLPIGEQKVLYAVNSICANDVDYCENKDDGSGNIVFSLSDFDGYDISVDGPASVFSPYTKITIDSDRRNLIISNDIYSKNNRQVYIGHDFGAKGSITCDNGSNLPCDSSSLSKTIKLKEESRNAFIDYQISNSDDEILNAKLKKEKQDNLDIIANRKNLIP